MTEGRKKLRYTRIPMIPGSTQTSYDPSGRGPRTIGWSTPVLRLSYPRGKPFRPLFFSSQYDECYHVVLLEWLENRTLCNQSIEFLCSVGLVQTCSCPKRSFPWEDFLETNLPSFTFCSYSFLFRYFRSLCFRPVRDPCFPKTLFFFVGIFLPLVKHH